MTYQLSLAWTQIPSSPTFCEPDLAGLQSQHIQAYLDSQTENIEKDGG